MPLTELTISGFRGFQSRGRLSPAVPNGSVGSGLTFLTGTNNSGKSSILECLRARAGNEGVSFTSGTRNPSLEAVEITYVINNATQTIRSISKGSSETIREGIDKSFEIFVLPSRRAFNPYFGRADYSRAQFVDSTPLPAQRSSVLNYFEYRLFSTLKDPTAFNLLLEEALGFKPEWTIDRSDQGQYFLKFFNGSHSHSSDGLGEGIISVFSIVDALYDSRAGSLIAIDEPELSLHPSLQKRVAAMLARFAVDRQIIVSTHSPYFVDLRALRQGAHLARITTSAKGTQIHQLSDDAKAAIGRLSEGNLYNPHVFGLDSRELFFQEDKIILTEGQEDVLLFPTVAKQIGHPIVGNFFGWGVGGAGNIRSLCRILQDLGFEKVAALLDGDKVSDVRALAAEFPSFFFGAIPAPDIRTKPERKAVATIVGLLDEKLLLRPEFVDQARTLLQALAQHMDA